MGIVEERLSLVEKRARTSEAAILNEIRDQADRSEHRDRAILNEVRAIASRLNGHSE